jgi:putative restriction endonuclease
VGSPNSVWKGDWQPQAMGCYPFGMVHPDAPSLLERLSEIRRWSRRGERAPHKPLLLLMALGRIQRGCRERLVPFSQIEPDLCSLLARFGPARRSYHPEFPFWHLQNDGLWEIPEKELLTPRKDHSSPTVGSIRETDATGGLPASYHADLRDDPDLVGRAARTLLEAHFPPSLHRELLDAVGLSIGEEARVGRRRMRDPGFRAEVLTAYNWSCAVCGFKGWLDGEAFGVEAAHVKWHCQDGPSTLDNGLCLCTMHHKALDRGVIGLDDRLRLMVSDHLEENEHTTRAFFSLADRQIQDPRTGYEPVAKGYRRWHLENCYRG